MLHSGSLVACDAGVVSVMCQREVGDTQRAGEIYVVYGDPQAGWDGLAVLLPGGEDRLVTRHDHTRYEDSLANGKAGKLKGVDGRWDCERKIYFNKLTSPHVAVSFSDALCFNVKTLCDCRNSK